MDRNPLATPPPDSEALRLFLGHFGLARGEEPESLLCDAATAFSRIPYENLTKLIKLEREGSAERARRWPLEVVSDHVASGAGGTCFSLTSTLLHILRGLGFEAEPILADRRYGPDTHCALVVFLGGAPHLVDPGFLITRPIPLVGGSPSPVRIRTSFNDVVLTPRDGGRKIDLHTIQGTARTYRLTFKAAPADAGQFLKAWDASFGWDMMRYPLLTRVDGGRQLYLQGRRLQVRSLESVARNELSLDDLAPRIAREFGVDPGIAARALEILRRKGELHGDAPAP